MLNDSAPPQQVELLSFQVADHDYAVDVSHVREIRSWTKPTPIPHAPAFVEGVINLRGSVLSIVDLATRLGIKGQSPVRNPRSVVVFVNTKDETVGLRVDAVSDILAFPSSELSQPPEGSSTPEANYIAALAIVEEDILRVLDLEALLRPAVAEEA